MRYDPNDSQNEAVSIDLRSRVLSLLRVASRIPSVLQSDRYVLVCRTGALRHVQQFASEVDSQSLLH